MPFKALVPEGSAPPMAPYSHGASQDGSVYVSGTLAMDKNGTVVGEGDIRKQTEQVIESIKAVLEAAGADLPDITFNMIFIQDMKDYAGLNEVYKRYFPGTPPARFCIVCELVKPEFLVEIASIAHLEHSR